MHASVGIAVGVATALLAGALTVGDSVRGSLKEHALGGLGRIEYALTATRYFREDLAGELEASTWFVHNAAQAVPVILLRGSMESGALGDTRRAGGVSVVGCTESFAALGTGDSDLPLDRSAITLTPKLADDLGVEAGDEVLLRIPVGLSQPAESLLGEKDDTVVSRRLRIAAVLPTADGLARFRISPSQASPRNAFVPLAIVQEMLERTDQVNTVLVARDPNRPGRPPDPHPAAGQEASLVPWADALRQNLQLADYGIQVTRISYRTPAGLVPAPDPTGGSDRSPPAASSYIQIASDTLVLPPHVVDSVERVLPANGMQPVITYLANSISIGQRTIPYSTITGIDSTISLGPLTTEQGDPLQLADHEIALNAWAANQLDAEIGDRITIRFYEPESTHGRLREVEPVPFELKSIIPLVGPDGQPTRAADRWFTPQIAGVTDQGSISDWEVPFPLNETIRAEDETYWDEYATTPKAFVSFAVAKRLWSSRFGAITSIRFDPAILSVVEIEQRLEQALDPGQFGFVLVPLREQVLAAAQGATSFDHLFLGFSMFLIAAAMMLIALLFQLGIQLRAGELGLLTALGLPGRSVWRIFMGEAAMVATLGAGIGVVGGVGYAWLMLAGLRTIWVAAIKTQLIHLHVTQASLVLGAILGLAAAMVPCWLALRSGIRVPPRSLLHGEWVGSIRQQVGRPGGRMVWSGCVMGLLVIAAVALGYLGTGKTGEAQAGLFFGAGALVLAAALLGMNGWLRRRGRWQDGRVSWTRGNLVGLAALSASRNPGRSLLCIGMVAAACFIIVSIGAFRLTTNRESTGGFDFIAKSDVPIQYDLRTTEGRLELGFSAGQEQQLAGVTIHACRVRDGDDASCLNLYRPRLPTLLGVPQDLIASQRFVWAAYASDRVPLDHAASPWSLLNQRLGTDRNGWLIVPVVLDADTAAYALHLGGVGTRFTLDTRFAGHPTTFEIVGLLAKSLLQGVLLISEDAFLQLDPKSGGYRYFLIDCPEPASGAEKVATDLESVLGDYGFDAVRSDHRLQDLFDVQNTYLSTFQSLGGLGLLLGTLGLAAVQLRSVVERRRELAVMRVLGFRRRRLAWMVLYENGLLLTAGMGIGFLAASCALLPHWFHASASLPWTGLFGMFLAIFMAGIAAGSCAVWKVVRAPLVLALRGQ